MFVWRVGANVCVVFFATKNDKESSVETLEEVVVSDSRFELKREHSGKTVIKVTRAMLDNQQGKTVAEVINTISGIEIAGSRSNAGQNLGYFVRGGNNRQVLVLIDGIQMNDASQIASDFDMRLLSSDQIESIEIVKGAASTLYGNGAATAVINITTRKASQKKISAIFSSTIASNQSQDDSAYNPADFSNSATLSGTLGAFTYLGGFSHQFTDGLSALNVNGATERDPFSRQNAQVKLGYGAGKAFEMAVYGNWDNYYAHYDNSYPMEDADFLSRSKQYRVGVAPKFNYRIGSVNVNAAFTEINREIESTYPNSYYAKNHIVDAFSKNKIGDRLHAIVGVNYKQDYARFASEHQIHYADPYLNLVYVSDFGLNFNGGVRNNNHSIYGSHWVYNLNPSYTLATNSGYTKFFGSYSTSYIAPTLYQLYATWGGNSDLKAEENITKEGGVEWKVNKNIRLSTLYFERLEKNFIDYVYTDPVTYDGGYDNVDRDFKVRGVEVEADASIGNKLSMSVNYTFTEKDDVAVLRIPKHKLNSLVGFKWNSKTYTSVSYQYNAERTDRDFTTYQDVTLDAYGLLDIYVSHQLLSRLKVFATVTNLLNEDYTEILGYTTRGRNARIGMSLQF